jgi:hypothetical protein
VSTLQTILGLSRITAVSSQTIQGLANIISTITTTAQTILGKSRITVSTARTITGKASIMSNILPSQPRVVYLDGRLAMRLSSFVYIYI